MTAERSQELTADTAEPLRQACASAIAARAARADRVNLEPAEAVGTDLLEALGPEQVPILAMAAVNDRCDDAFLQRCGLGDGFVLRATLLGFGGVVVRDGRPTLPPRVRESVLAMFRRLDYHILSEAHRLSSVVFLDLGEPLEALRHAVTVEDRDMCETLLRLHQQEWLLAGHADEIREAYSIVDANHGLSFELTRQGWNHLDSGHVANAYSFARLASLAARPDEFGLASADRAILRVQSAFLMGDLRGASAAVPTAIRLAHDAGLLDVAHIVSAGLIGRGLVDIDHVPAARPDSAIHLGAQGVRQALAHVAAGNLLAAQRVMRDVAMVLETLPMAFAPIDLPILAARLSRELSPTWGAADLSAVNDLNRALQSPLLHVESLYLHALERFGARDVPALRNILVQLEAWASDQRTSQDLAALARLRQADVRARMGHDAAALALVQQDSISAVRHDLLLQLTARHQPRQAIAQARESRSQSAWAEIRFLLISACIASDDRERERTLSAALDVAHEFGYGRSLLEYLPGMRPHVLAAMSKDTRFSSLASRLGSAIAPESLTSLTQRQIEIMRYFAAGMTVHEVATATGLAPGTAKAHAVHVAQRLGVRSREEAIEELRKLAAI